jgi:nucleoside-diphosphate-sugar epimerase
MAVGIMKVLVTGATGFIGSRLVFSLLNNNDTVGILKRDESVLKNLEPIKDKIMVYKSNTYSDINTGIKKFMPDVIIHMATMAIYKHKPENIFEIINANIIFGTYVLEAMTENKVPFFVNIGTRWQHLGNKRYCPVNLYAATKESFRDILVYYEREGIMHKTVEFSDTFGDGDTRQKVFNLIINAFRDNHPLDLSLGEQILDLLYVEDICKYIINKIGMKNFYDNKVISLSGTTIKLRELGIMIEKHYENKGILKWGGKPYRENEVMEMPKYYQEQKLNKNSLEEYIKKIIKA